jgi:hypothetical protein
VTNEGGTTSPWLYVGLGCVLAVGLAVGTVVGLGYLGLRKAERFAADLADPQARSAKVQRVLGYAEPPPGYHPAVSFSIPMLLRVAILSDQPPSPEGEPVAGSRTFVFVDAREFGNDRQEVRDYLEGRSEWAPFFERTQVSTRGHRELGSPRQEAFARGSFEEGGVTYRWASYRVPDGLETLVQVECPRPGRRVRIGVWSAPDGAVAGAGSPEDVAPEPWAAEGGDPDLAALPAAEPALREFVGHLRLCP